MIVCNGFVFRLKYVVGWHVCLAFVYQVSAGRRSGLWANHFDISTRAPKNAQDFCMLGLLGYAGYCQVMNSQLEKLESYKHQSHLLLTLSHCRETRWNKPFVFLTLTRTDLKGIIFLGVRHACLVVLLCLDIDVEHSWTSKYKLLILSLSNIKPVKCDQIGCPTAEWFWTHHKTVLQFSPLSLPPWNAKDLITPFPDPTTTDPLNFSIYQPGGLDHLLRTTSDSISTRACVPVYLVAFGRTSQREIRNLQKMNAPSCS